MGKTRLIHNHIPARPVHPHACGENVGVLSWNAGIRGPPPRVWGKRHCEPGFPGSFWSTPTRVGKTPHPRTIGQDLQVHPHACGENVGLPPMIAQPGGPPPRVWGKLTLKRFALPRRRSTPTRVGKTAQLASRSARKRVHPHACGENDSQTDRRSDCIGPPPRVWGKLCMSAADVTACRSTPTRVGKTLSSFMPPVKISVHPHACGENAMTNILGRSMLGPPPRVWGKRWQPQAYVKGLRSTPTRVGKTRRIFKTRSISEVHPHACGENAAHHFLPLFCGGPPPRVWGKRLLESTSPQRMRSTPTRVGKTKARNIGDVVE